MKRVMILAGTVAVLILSGNVTAADGKDVFDKTCAGCHKFMKPKMGDKVAWAPRIALGVDTLTASVMTGKKPMPPKGGNADATEDDIRAAVEYIVSQNK